MLLLNKGIAESMIDYRIDRLMAARKKAMAYGFKGAMFPWESDDYGEESTPTFALTGPLEHHITADISIAAGIIIALPVTDSGFGRKHFR
jgi:trehalose/maltose hydrolase-like predicted phosphorylase